MRYRRLRLLSRILIFHKQYFLPWSETRNKFFLKANQRGLEKEAKCLKLYFKPKRKNTLKPILKDLILPCLDSVYLHSQPLKSPIIPSSQQATLLGYPFPGLGYIFISSYKQKIIPVKIFKQNA
jgi:hypothetical protein